MLGCRINALDQGLRSRLDAVMHVGIAPLPDVLYLCPVSGKRWWWNPNTNDWYWDDQCGVEAYEPAMAVSVDFLDMESGPVQATSAKAASDPVPIINEAEAATLAAAGQDLIWQAFLDNGEADQRPAAGGTATDHTAAVQPVAIMQQAIQAAGAAAQLRAPTPAEAIAAISKQLEARWQTGCGSRTPAAEHRGGVECPGHHGHPG